jgi:hypothetical protein
MPTITPALKPQATATAIGLAPALLALGDGALPFAAMFEGAADDPAAPVASPIPALPRQPLAAPGIALPVLIPTIAVATAPPVALRTVDAPAVPAADGLENPFILDEYPAPEDAIPLALPEMVDAPGLAPPTLAADAPPTPVIIPYAAPPPIAAPAPRTAKAAALPLISVARQPGAPARTAREMSWSAAPPEAPPAPPSAAPPVAAPAPTVAVPADTLEPAPSLAPSAIPTTSAPATPSPAPPSTTPSPPSQATPVAAPVLQPLAPPILAGPALQVFGAARAVAALELRERSAPDLSAPALDAGFATAPILAAAPADAAGQPLLDMRQERWPQAMIAHIEQLRDAANAVDTRIRLIPDALGTIDVAVSRDGDTLNVRFTADQAATRTLLHDAQPRLAAIAEERGLRLGQTAVDAGTAGSTPQQQRQPQQPRDAMTPGAPRRATTDDRDTDRAATGRLA